MLVRRNSANAGAAKFVFPINDFKQGHIWVEHADGNAPAQSSHASFQGKLLEVASVLLPKLKENSCDALPVRIVCSWRVSAGARDCLQHFEGVV